MSSIMLNIEVWLTQPVTILWIDIFWISFFILLIVLATVFYFLNRHNPVNRLFAILLLIIAYFTTIGILVVSLRILEPYFAILLMPILCYIGFVFHLFIKAVLSETKAIGRIEWYYFLFGLIFTIYVFYMLIDPTNRDYLRQTSKVVNHNLIREYTQGPVYIIYALYMLIPFIFSAYKLVKVMKQPNRPSEDIYRLVKTLFFVFSSCVVIAVITMSALPILGFQQSTFWGSFALMIFVIYFSWTLLRHRAWRLEAITEKLREREIELSERNQIIEADLDLARAIHRSVLPARFANNDYFDYHVYYEPMEKVGGDIYDITDVGDKIRLVIGDVSGHGVAAGLFSAMSSVLLRSRWSDPEISLTEIVSFLNNELTGYSVKGVFVSAQFIEFSKITNQATIVNAGHPAAFRISFDTVEKLPGRGRPLGIFADVLFQCYEFEFYRGDTLFLYTDGLIEARNTDGDEFEVDGLKQTLKKSIPLAMIERQKFILNRLHSFTQTDSNEDDVTIIQVCKK